MKLFLVITNTDLTEGRGFNVPIHVCNLESTALRLAKKAGVMGSNAEVKGCETVCVEGREYLLLDYVSIKTPTSDDLKDQVIIDGINDKKSKRIAAIEAARALGMSEDQLKDLA